MRLISPVFMSFLQGCEQEKKANLKIVKYLHFPLAGYAEFVGKAKQGPK